MKLVAISDTHDKHREVAFPQIPDGDILIHAGDATKSGDLAAFKQFIEWFASQPHEYKILVAGNHDICLDFTYVNEKKLPYYPMEELRKKAMECATQARAAIPDDIFYLEDDWVEINRTKFYGSPWTPRFVGKWGFNRKRGAAIAERWEQIPDDVDVLITHGPPYGHGDLGPPFGSPFLRHAGCLELLKKVIEIKPTLHIFGHIHGGYGIYQSDELPTTFVNVATCNEKYQPCNKPQLLNYRTPTDHLP